MSLPEPPPQIRPPPATRPRYSADVFKREFYTSLRDARHLRLAFNLAAMLFCTVVPVVVSALHFGRSESLASIGQPRPPNPAGSFFWFGLFLFVMGQFKNIEVAIRESQLLHEEE